MKTYTISELDYDHVEWIEWKGETNPFPDDSNRVCAVLYNGGLIINYPSLIDWSYNPEIPDWNVSVYVVLANAN
jgi:hypothetical protein